MRPLFLFLLFLLPVCTAQGAGEAALSYSEALSAAVGASAAVNIAQVDLASAERDLSRLQADPLALRIPVLQAEQALMQARQGLGAAEAAARNSAAEAYAKVLEARSDVSLTEKRVAIIQTQADATQIRFEAGAATSLDVASAQNALQSVQRDLTDAREAQTLAYSRLASLVGLAGAPVLSDAVPVGTVPSLAEALTGLDENSALVNAQQGLVLANAQLAGVDSAFSARRDIEAARDAVANAETHLQETRRSLELSTRQSRNAAVAAQNRVQGAAADLTAAQETLQAQQVRFEAGGISQLELAQSELNAQSAAAALEAAQHALAAALRTLDTTLRGGTP